MATSWAARALWLRHTLSLFTWRERCRHSRAITFAAGLEQAAAWVQVLCADISGRQTDGAGDTAAIRLCILGRAFLGLRLEAVGRLRSTGRDLRQQQCHEQEEDGATSCHPCLCCRLSVWITREQPVSLQYAATCEGKQAEGRWMPLGARRGCQDVRARAAVAQGRSCNKSEPRDQRCAGACAHAPQSLQTRGLRVALGRRS